MRIPNQALLVLAFWNGLFSRYVNTGKGWLDITIVCGAYTILAFAMYKNESGGMKG